MLNWAVIFFVIALVTAILGFSSVAAASAGIAKIFLPVPHSFRHLARSRLGAASLIAQARKVNSS